MNTQQRHALTALFLLVASARPALANDMTMVLPIFAVPFLLVGAILAISLWIIARATGVRTGVLTTILVVGTVLSGIPGTMAAVISMSYVSSQHADIAIFYLIAFLVYLALLILAFRGIRRRKGGRTDAAHTIIEQEPHKDLEASGE